MNLIKDILSYFGLTKIVKTDEIGQQLKEYLKTNNEWKPDFNERTLPSFKMGKVKHNNRTGLNTFDSNTKVYQSFGRNKITPLGYTCDFETEEMGNNVQITLRDFGINVPLQISPSIRLEFSDANRFISKFTTQSPRDRLYLVEFIYQNGVRLKKLFIRLHKKWKKCRQFFIE